MSWKLIRILDTYVGIPLMYMLLGLRKLFRRPSRAEAPQEPRKILFVKFWGIGNLFMMLPSAEALRRAYPGIELDILTLETNRDAALATGAFSGIATIDTKNVVRFVATTFRQLIALRGKQYDRIVDFEQFARFSAIFCALIGRGGTIGFNTSGQYRHFLYTHPVLYNNDIHVTQSYGDLARAAGAVLADPRSMRSVTMRPPDDLLQRGVMDKLRIRSERIVIVMHIGTSSNFKERRWPMENFRALSDLLISHHDVQIVITGLAEESFLASAVAQELHRDDLIVDASGQLNFKEYYALIRLSDLVVSADTAAVHVASAAGTPVVGLYGPNTPQLYGPWGENDLAFYGKLDCSPCITNFNAKIHVCRHPDGKGACMLKISADDVYQGIRERYFDTGSVHKLRKRSQAEPCTRS